MLTDISIVSFANLGMCLNILSSYFIKVNTAVHYDQINNARKYSSSFQWLMELQEVENEELSSAEETLWCTSTSLLSKCVFLAVRQNYTEELQMTGGSLERLAALLSLNIMHTVGITLWVIKTNLNK